MGKLTVILRYGITYDVVSEFDVPDQLGDRVDIDSTRSRFRGRPN